MGRKETDMNMADETKLPCSDKISFDTKAQAEATATTTHYWYGHRPHAYRCQYCQLWHLSTSES